MYDYHKIASYTYFPTAAKLQIKYEKSIDKITIVCYNGIIIEWWYMVLAKIEISITTIEMGAIRLKSGMEDAGLWRNARPNKFPKAL